MRARFIALELDPTTVRGIPAWRENSYAYIRSQGDRCSKCNADVETVSILGEIGGQAMKLLLCADCICKAISDVGGL